MANIEKGFTLVEVIVALGIATIAGALLLAVIVTSAGLFTNQSSKVQTGLNSNDALEVFRSSIKQASAIQNQYTNGQESFTTGANQLVLKVASLNSSGSVIEDTFDYFIFYSDQEVLRYKVFPDAASTRRTANQILTNFIEDINFEYLNDSIPPVEVEPVSAKRIRLTLTLKQKSGADVQTSIATSEANLRND